MCQHRAMNRKRLTRKNCREETRVQLAALLDASLPLDHIHTRARQIYGQMYRNSQSFMNWREARMLAARNSKFRPKLNALLPEKRSEVVGLIEYLYRRVGIAAPVPPNVMAMGFMSLEGERAFQAPGAWIGEIGIEGSLAVVDVVA